LGKTVEVVRRRSKKRMREGEGEFGGDDGLGGRRSALCV
jgi:hypothetical protein